MASNRRPRFNRSPEIPPIQLTDRDTEIIRQVFQHRFLRSTHLRSLMGGSRQQLLRRLQRLFHHGYLDRPRTQIDYYRAGSQAMVYGLGRQGIKLLEERCQVPPQKADWTAKNRTATRLFLEHTLAVADVMVTLEIACREHGEVEFVRYGPPRDEQMKWRVRVQHGGGATEIGVVPDRLFGLRLLNQASIAWFFLEADRATMPIQRHGLKQTSFYRKLLAYYETWRQGLLKDMFPRFRVLTVTTSPQRVEGLIESNRTLTQGKGSGLFLFADKASFCASRDVLILPLLNGRGERVTLMQ
jgi:hypothetical protein